MRTKAKTLLAALLLLLVLSGCGADSAAQPEPGTVAAAMAEITAEKIDDGFIDQYPQITVEQLVTALHDAVFCEITKEEAEAAGYGQEDGWGGMIAVSGSPAPASITKVNTADNRGMEHKIPADDKFLLSCSFST